MLIIMVITISSLHFQNLSWFRYAKEMEAWELARLQKDDRFGIGLLICLTENGFVGAHCINYDKPLLTAITKIKFIFGKMIIPSAAIPMRLAMSFP